VCKWCTMSDYLQVKVFRYRFICLSEKHVIAFKMLTYLLLVISSGMWTQSRVQNIHPFWWVRNNLVSDEDPEWFSSDPDPILQNSGQFFSNWHILCVQNGIFLGNMHVNKKENLDHLEENLPESHRFVKRVRSGFGSGLWIRIRIRIGSVFNWKRGSGSGSVFAIRIRIRIQEGKNDPQK